MTFIAYCLRSFFKSCCIIWITATAAFYMVRMAPGNPFDQERATRPEVSKALKAYYGLDASWTHQYTTYIKKLVRGDLGPSFQFPSLRVQSIIRSKIAISFELGVYAFILVLILGVGLGLVSVAYTDQWQDRIIQILGLAGLSFPNFIVGPILISFFSIKLGWLPVGGWGSWQQKVLPTITLACYYSALLMRFTRTQLIDIKNQSYIRTAYAKGLSSFQIYTVHILKNSLAPIIAYLSPVLVGLLSGSFVVESLFNIPGLGRFFIQAAFSRDYSLILGITLLFTTVLCLINMITEWVLYYLNPKRLTV